MPLELALSIYIYISINEERFVSNLPTINNQRPLGHPHQTGPFVGNGTYGLMQLLGPSYHMSYKMRNELKFFLRRTLSCVS